MKFSLYCSLKCLLVFVLVDWQLKSVASFLLQTLRTSRRREMTILHANADSGKSRKRRIKGSASSGPKTGDDGGFDSSDFERSDMLTPAASSTPSKFDISMNKDDSKLPPLAGTLEERRAQFQEKSGLQRNVEQLLAPTPVGEEPKIVQLAKAVTWGAVILLVVLEIVVSVKVGGAPFDFSKASTGGTPTTETNQNLPPLPDKSKLEYGYDAIGYGEVRPGYESNTGK